MTSDSNPYAISIRLKNYDYARADFQRKHDARIGKQPAYVDTSRIDLNTGVTGPTPRQYRDLMLERRTLTNPKRAAKSNVAIMTGGIITFGHLAQRDFLKLSDQQQDALYTDIAQAIATKLGNEITAWAAHRDEEAPHAHFQMPSRRPTDGKTMSEVLKPAITSQLQDLAASIAQTYVPTIQRGFKKAQTGARNKSIGELHRSAAADLEAKQTTSNDLKAQINTEKQTLLKAQLKAQKQEARRDKALLQARENETIAEKKLKLAKTYERRAEAARQTVLQAEDRLKILTDQLEDLNNILAQKKTKVANLIVKRNSLKAKLSALRAA